MWPQDGQQGAAQHDQGTAPDHRPCMMPASVAATSSAAAADAAAPAAAPTWAAGGMLLLLLQPCCIRDASFAALLLPLLLYSCFTWRNHIHLCVGLNIVMCFGSN